MEFTLGSRAFAYWEMEIHDWFVESGAYEIQIGTSASEIVLSKEIHVESEKVIPKVYTVNSTFGEVMADPKARAVFEALGKELNVGESLNAISPWASAAKVNPAHVTATTEMAPTINIFFILLFLLILEYGFKDL